MPLGQQQVNNTGAGPAPPAPPPEGMLAQLAASLQQRRQQQTAAMQDTEGMQRGMQQAPAFALGAPMDIAGLLTAAVKAAAGGTLEGFGANAQLPGGSEHLMELAQRHGLLPQLQGTPGEGAAIALAGTMTPGPDVPFWAKPRYRHKLATGHTLERTGRAETPGTLRRVREITSQSFDPPPVDLAPYEENIRKRLAGESLDNPWADFDFGALESSDIGARAGADAQPSGGMFSDDPLIEAISMGELDPYEQLWAVRGAEGGDPEWLIKSHLNVGVTEKVSRGKNIPDPDAREVPMLTIDIASRNPEIPVGTQGDYSFISREGYNELGMAGLRDAVTNILAWYQSKNIRPELIGGLRVRQERYGQRMQVPAEKFRTEIAKAWVAAFGVAAAVPHIIFEDGDDSPPR